MRRNLNDVYIRKRLTSSLVVSILAMSQVCMQERPETEITARPLTQNSITVHHSQGDTLTGSYGTFSLFNKSANSTFSG